jgi:hypothetical protein
VIREEQAPCFRWSKAHATRLVAKLGLVVIFLTATGLFLVLDWIPLDEPVRSLLLSGVFTSLGLLMLCKTDKAISPIFASSRFMLWTGKALGLCVLLLGLAGLVSVVGNALGFWQQASPPASTADLGPTLPCSIMARSVCLWTPV